MALTPPPPKVSATITVRQPWHAIATDAYGVDYFLNYKSCQQLGRYQFNDLEIGSKVKLTPIEAERGKFRGIEVEIVEI